MQFPSSKCNAISHDFRVEMKIDPEVLNILLYLFWLKPYELMVLWERIAHMINSLWTIKWSTSWRLSFEATWIKSILFDNVIVFVGLILLMNSLTNFSMFFHHNYYCSPEKKNQTSLSEYLKIQITVIIINPLFNLSNLAFFIERNFFFFLW